MPDNVDDWYKKHREQQEAEHKKALESIHELAPKLAKFDVEKLVAAYDGSGDSGDFEGIYLEPDTHSLDDVLRAIGMSRNSLTEMLWPFLPFGWEINEGSYGELTLDVKTNKLRRVHNERIEEINTSEDEF